MADVKRVRLGFMPTRRRFFSREDAVKYKGIILDRIRTLAPEMDVFDLEWLNEDGLLRSVSEVPAVVDYFRKHAVDALFVPHCNFGTEDAVASAAHALKIPLLLWGPRDEAPLADGERLRDSQCGLFATSKVLQRFGVKFSYIVNSAVDSPVFAKGFLNFLRAADGVRHFQNARIGQVGTRPRDFYSVMVNEGELLEKFGTRIVPTDLSKLVVETRKQFGNPSEQVRAIAADLQKTADFSEVSPDLPIRLAAFQFAMKRWAENEQLDAIAMQCWDELQNELGLCSCFVHGQLTSAGLPVACETDIHGALSSLLLQGCLHFKEPTFFADLTIRHPQNDNAELLWHCGPFPADLACGPCKIGKHFVLPGHAEGVCNWSLRSGELTVARFDGVNGHYSLFCGEGRSVAGPVNKGTYVYLEVPDWPLWEEKLIYGPYIHHVSGAFGRWSAALCEAVRYIDALEFDPAQPTLKEIRKDLREG